MALVETLTALAPAGATTAYTDLPAPAPVEVRLSVPEVWFVHECYEQLGSTNTSANVSGFLQVVYSTAVGNTLQIKVGDVLQYDDLQGNVTAVSFGATNRITTDIPFTSLAANQDCWVAYINRTDRLTAMTATVGTDAYQPQRIGQLYTNGNVSDGDVSTAYYYNASSFARSKYRRPQRPVMDDTDSIVNSAGYGVVYMEVAMALIGGTVQVALFETTNATTYKSGTISQQANGTAIAKWTHRRYGCVQAPTYQRVGGTYIGAPQTSPTFSYPANPNHVLVCWLNRYGAPEMLPFSYLNQEAFEAELVDTFRQGNEVRNLATRAVDTLNLTTGLINSRYRDWFEDLQVSPYVFVAFDYQVKATADVTYVDVDGTDWVEYRIMPGTLNTKSAINTVMNLQFALTKVQERTTYTN